VIFRREDIVELGARLAQQLLSRLPIGRGEHRILVDRLQRIERTQHFGCRASDIGGITGHRADHAVRIDEEGRADRGAVIVARRDHAIGAPDDERGILDDREAYFDIEAVADHPQPGEMREQAVDRQRHEVAFALRELVGGLCQRHELGRADRGEVGRVREQDQPAPATIRQPHVACGTPGGKIGCDIADPEAGTGGDMLAAVFRGIVGHADCIPLDIGNAIHINSLCNRME
jgi:hypothetical protein